VKYLMLIYGNQEKWASIPAGEWPEAIARQDAFNRKYRATSVPERRYLALQAVRLAR